MRSLAFISAIALLACEGSSISLVYTIDDPQLASAVTRFSVEVYQPGQQGYDCEALAFGEVRPVPALTSSFDSENQPDLGQVSRSATKLFVLKGYADTSEEALIAGCAVVGAVQGAQRIEVLAEPVTQVNLRPLPQRLGPPPDAWEFSLQDGLERPQAGVVVRWEVFGAGMRTAQTGEVRSGLDGSGLVEGPTPTAPGPVQISLRSKWGGPAVTQVAFRPAKQHDSTLNGISTQFALMRAFGGASLLGLTQLTPQESMLSQYALQDGVFMDGLDGRTEFISGDWRLGQSSASTFLLSQSEVRQVSLPSEEELALGPPEPFDSGSPNAPQNIIDLSGCDPDVADPLVMVEFGEFQFGLFDGRLKPVNRPALQGDLDAILSSGCLSRAEGAALRVAWTQGDLEGQLRVRTGLETGFSLVTLSPQTIGVAFGGQSSSGSQAALTTSIVGRTTQIAVAPRLAQQSGEWLLLSDPPEPLLGLPQALGIGDNDGNGRRDVIAVTRIDPQRVALYVIVFGEQQTAAAGFVLPGNIVSPWLGVADLDQDGKDDIIVGEQQPSASERFLVILQMGRSAE